MIKIAPLLAASFLLCASNAAFAQQCPDPASQNATTTISALAYDLQDGATYSVTAGGTAKLSDCDDAAEGYVPMQASIRLDLKAAEGKEAIIGAESSCTTTVLWVATPDLAFTEMLSADTSMGFVSVLVPRSAIGDDQTILIYVGSGAEGESCAGTVQVTTARG